MNKAVIIHCWGGKPNSRWYPWVKTELEKLNFNVEIPQMPDTDNPNLDKWLSKLDETIIQLGGPDETLFLIGHSLGCITAMRYLENLPKDIKVGALIMVAGFTDDLGDLDQIEDQLKSFFDKEIEFEKIKNSVKNQIVAIHSDNDPYVDLKHADVFKKKLEAKVIIKHNMGHFSEPDGGGDVVIVKELPIVAEKIIEMTKS